MKILHLLQSNQFSGAENVVCQIVDMTRHLPEYEMVYCSRDGQIREALDEREITFVPITKMCVREVQRVIREQKPDLIHAHDMGASFFAALVCGKIPLISHIHNNNFDSRKPTVKAILYRFAATRAKHIFWVSRSAQEGYCFRKGLEKKSSILYNVINAEQLREKAAQAECQTAYDIVFLGRLTYPKNPQRLLDVLERVAEQKPDVQAAIIGSGEMEEEVRGIIAEKRLQKNVHCLGFMSNPYGILWNSKVMLMTSRWEGLPMCALEAMTLGVPIVSTPTDGLRELIADGENGCLSDEDQTLAQRCLMLINDKEARGNFSKSCINKARVTMGNAAYKAQVLTEYKA